MKLARLLCCFRRIFGRSMSGNMEDEARPWQSYHTVYTNAKAGMDGVDKEKVQRIVYEMSKGSKYFENEERKEAFIKQKIENMRAQCAKLTATDLSHYQMIADKRILELESGRDLSRTWLHIDMDAFYAAVETLENPLLKGKPMAVGGMSMISTANYEARKYGVRAAMPGFIARKLCQDLIFVPPDFKKYTRYSDLTRKVFQKYDTNYVASGLDEAYLDITEVCKERAISSVEIAEELRKCIYEETGLTCSAGVAPNRLLAKVCSDINKPNGQFVLPNDRMCILTFISSLPIRKIGGIGKVTERILSDVLGINTCEEMLQKCAFLCALFSHSSTDFFLSVGLGLGKTDAPEVRSRKSMSSERTFSATNDEDLLYQKLADIAATLSSDMEKEGLSGRTLTLKLKTASFEVQTRAVSLHNHINSREDILIHASKLLKAELPISLRLIGKMPFSLFVYEDLVTVPLMLSPKKRKKKRKKKSSLMQHARILFHSIGIRMSHFNDEKDGPADPMQKKLTSFIIPGGSSAKLTCSNNSMSASSGNSGRGPMDHTGTCLPIYAQNNTFLDPLHNWESENPSNSNQLLDFEQMHDSAGEMEREFISKLTDGQAEVATADTTASGMQMAKTKSFSGYSESNCVDKLNKRTNLSDEVNKKQQTQILWEDDYKCALCGAELPPSFIEERQEHSDYHFAEMLQKEETELNERDLIRRQRTSHVVQHMMENKRKKRKNNPKESSHLPIDMFFVKSNQNF